MAGSIVYYICIDIVLPLSQKEKKDKETLLPWSVLQVWIFANKLTNPYFVHARIVLVRNVTPPDIFYISAFIKQNWLNSKWTTLYNNENNINILIIFFFVLAEFETEHPSLVLSIFIALSSMLNIRILTFQFPISTVYIL